MIKNGFDVNEKIILGDILIDGVYQKYIVPPLFICSFKSKPKLVFALLKAGADPNCISLIQDLTPLLVAATQHDNELIMNTLLMYGACINNKNVNGNTPLHIAVKNNRLNNAIFLLENGSDYSIKNNVGDTAYDIVKTKNNQEEIINVFERFFESIAPTKPALF
jgi:ankyrin repeat protein